MITLLIVLGSIATYLCLGRLACRYTVPRGIQRGLVANRREYPYLYAGDEGRRLTVRENGTAWLVFTMLLWFLAVPLTPILSRGMLSADRYAPWAREAELAEKAARLAEREREIAKLERELGIGR